MSSAFRNFILTLVLMLAVFGIAAWKLVPKLENAVLEPVFSEAGMSSGETSEPESSASDTSEPVSEETSEPAEKQFALLDCLLLAKNDAGSICAAFYIRASEEDHSYLVCTMPFDMCLDNSGLPVPLYDLLGSQSIDYAVKKLSALVGHDVANYAVADSDMFAGLAELKKDLTFDLPYDAKFINPEFAMIPESQRSDEHYLTVAAGKVTLSASNAAGLFNSQRSEENIDYTFQQNMCAALIKQVCADTRFITDLVAQKKLHTLLDTNMSYDSFNTLASLTFSYGTAKQKSLTYPTQNDYTTDSIVPDWATGISKIESAA